MSGKPRKGVAAILFSSQLPSLGTTEKSYTPLEYFRLKDQGIQGLLLRFVSLDHIVLPV